MSNIITDDPLADDAAAPRAEISVASAQARLVESQMRVARAIEQQQQCRGFVATALAAFQKATSQTTNFEQLAREHIAASNQERADRVAGKIPQRGGQRRLGSAVDAFAYHTRNQGRGAGGGEAFRRGAHRGGRRLIVPK
jgi:hypothetical protein